MKAVVLRTSRIKADLEKINDAHILIHPLIIKNHGELSLGHDDLSAETSGAKKVRQEGNRFVTLY